MAEPVFRITYWGITGTLTAPLRPPELTAKLVQAITALAEAGRLAPLALGPGLRASVEQAVASLPFHLRAGYGGNTTCVEVQTPDALLVFDCGSGFRELGIALDARWKAAGPAARREGHVLITHPHMDHTFATPYFTPYYNPANKFTIWSTPDVMQSMEAVLSPEAKLSQVFFPPTYEQLKAIKELKTILPGQTFQIGSTTIKTYSLHHPGGSLAFRLENAGKVFVFATDHEQKQVPDLGLADFARNADLFYTEGQYTQEEYEGKVGVSGDMPMSRKGWGHSPVEACVATAVAAGVRTLHVGHRDPRRSDEHIAAVDQYVCRLMHEALKQLGKPPQTCQALIPYEGLTVLL